MENNTHSKNDYKNHFDSHKEKQLLNIENELLNVFINFERIKNHSDLLKTYEIEFKNICEEWKNVNEEIFHLTGINKSNFINKNKTELERIINGIEMICTHYEQNIPSLSKISQLTNELEKSSNKLKEMLKQITKLKNKEFSPITYGNEKINIEINNVDSSIGYEIKDKKRTMVIHMPDKKTITIYEVI